MASSTGNFSGSATLQTSEDLQLLMDRRQQKRMQSNRESARRSRMRKQQRVDELMAQVTQLRKDNARIHSDINITSQHYMDIEAENSILRAQMAELARRLQAFEEIGNCINNGGFGETEEVAFQQIHTNVVADCFMNPMNFMFVNQPIMAAAADIFHCEF